MCGTAWFRLTINVKAKGANLSVDFNEAGLHFGHEVKTKCLFQILRNVLLFCKVSCMPQNRARRAELCNLNTLMEMSKKCLLVNVVLSLCLMSTAKDLIIRDLYFFKEQSLLSVQTSCRNLLMKSAV